MSLAGIPYPFEYFEKYPISLKRNWQISPKFTQMYLHILKLLVKFHKSISYPFNYLANMPMSLKPFQCLNSIRVFLIFEMVRYVSLMKCSSCGLFSLAKMMIYLQRLIRILK